MMRGGGTDTPLPQVLSSVGTYTQEGEEEDILDAGSQSSADEVTNLVHPSRLYKTSVLKSKTNSRSLHRT